MWLSLAPVLKLRGRSSVRQSRLGKQVSDMVGLQVRQAGQDHLHHSLLRCAHGRRPLPPAAAVRPMVAVSLSFEPSWPRATARHTAAGNDCSQAAHPVNAGRAAEIARAVAQIALWSPEP
jgi:hypothetical protein